MGRHTEWSERYHLVHDQLWCPPPYRVLCIVIPRSMSVLSGTESASSTRNSDCLQVLVLMSNLPRIVLR